MSHDWSVPKKSIANSAASVSIFSLFANQARRSGWRGLSSTAEQSL